MALTEIEIKVCAYVTDNGPMTMNELKQGLSPDPGDHGGFAQAAARMVEQGILTVDKSSRSHVYDRSPAHVIDYSKLKAV